MPNNNRFAKVILAIALLPLLVLSTQLFGQSASTISGTVMDTSQAVLPNSSVTAINTATGISTSVVTNNAGNYNFPSLQPGIYKITAESKGFQTASKTDVKLQMGSQLRLNFDMQVSGGNTEIEVSTSAENLMLEAGSSTGTVLQTESVTQLPLASNDVMDLINVMGGVVKAENPIFGNSEQTFAGVSSGSINIQRDGITVNEVRYTSGIVSPIRINQEMVGEFKMVLSPVDAEMGRGAGQVQILTKSGSNNYHGSAVWNVQNTALDASEWEMNKSGKKPNWRNLNNYTLSASGPVIKNKTFFFATWDQQIVRSKTLVQSRALTNCARKGIYRHLAGMAMSVPVVVNGVVTDPSHPILKGIQSGNSLTNPTAAGGITTDATIVTRATVWGPGLNSSVTNTGNYQNGDPLLNYNGTLGTDRIPAQADLYYESVLGQLGATARTQIAQDPINCSAYVFDPLGSGGTGLVPGTLEGVGWDSMGYRNRYDQTGYVQRFTNMMPPANDFSTGDGLNVAAHAWTRVLHGSDTVFGSGEDNERKSITVKIDHNINSAHRVSGTYTHESDYGEDAYPTWPVQYGAYGGAVSRTPTSFTATLTSTLRPTLLNEFRLGRSSSLTHTNEPYNNPKFGDKMVAVMEELLPLSFTPNYTGDKPLVVGIGSGNMEFSPETSSHPYGSRGNLPTTWGGTDPRWSLSDTITWTRGAHSFKGGFDMRFARSKQDTNGAASFSGGANAFPFVKSGTSSASLFIANSFGKTAGWTAMSGDDNNGSAPTGDYGNAYALLNYMTGSVNQVRQWFFVNDAKTARWNDPSQGEIVRTMDLSNKEFSFFFKDDWKVSSALTLNLGARYEYYGIPQTASGMTAAIKGGSSALWRGGKGFSEWMPTINGTTAPPALGELATYEFVGPNSPNPDRSPWNKDMNNFAPHVGFAWQLPWFGKGKTTMRGGYSVSYSTITNFDGFATALANVPGSVWQYNLGGGGNVPNYLDLSSLPTMVPLIPPASNQPLKPSTDTYRKDTITVYDENIRNPYVQSLNLSVTRNVGNNLTVDVRYIATLGRKSISSININQVNYFNNGLFEALQTVRQGGQSDLINALISNRAGVGYALSGSGTGSDRVRSNSITRNNLVLGNFSAIASSLATSNGNNSATYNVNSTLVGGALLRNGCLPSQQVGGVCPTGVTTPENFIIANPQFAGANINKNLGHSNYHSLQAQVTMRPTRGLSFQMTYTLSKNLADQGWSDFRSGGRREYYLSGQNRTHSLSSYGTFDLPFGANGFLFRNSTGVLKKAIEGWQISWIASITSGMPMSLTGISTAWGSNNIDIVNPQYWDNKSGGVEWANKASQGYYFGNSKYVPAPDPQCKNTSLIATGSLANACDAWYTAYGMRSLAYDLDGSKTYTAGDPIVFQNSVPGVRGNFDKNNMEGPGRWSLDMAMGKSVEFMEGRRFEFRIDAQNIFNHPTPSGSAAYAWNARATQIYNPYMSLNFPYQQIGTIVSKGNHRTFQAKIRITF